MARMETQREGWGGLAVPASFSQHQGWELLTLPSLSILPGAEAVGTAILIMMGKKKSRESFSSAKSCCKTIHSLVKSQIWLPPFVTKTFSIFSCVYLRISLGGAQKSQSEKIKVAAVSEQSWKERQRHDPGELQWESTS